MTRFQNGSLKRVMRKQGESWMLRYRKRRALDGRWVEATPIFIGTVSQFPSEEAAWHRVESLHLNLNSPASGSLGAHPVTFNELVSHYCRYELSPDQSEAQIEKAHSTITTYKRYLRKWALPRWETQVAMTLDPIEVETWLRELGRRHGLENPTRAKIRQAMSLVYKHGQRYSLLPRGDEGNPLRFVRQSTTSSFEPIILSLAEAFAILNQLDLMKRTLVLVIAATALRISEILALQWKDVDSEGQQIQVTKAWVYGQFGKPKSKASKRPVPLHPLLAAHLTSWREQSPYATDEDFIFPSLKLKGRKPPRANMLVADHLKPAAGRAGVKGNVGFHTFRRTLAAHLVANNYDPKLAQELLRHSNIRTTLDIYAQAITPKKLEAQGTFLRSLLAQGEANGLVQ
jgi:integrase